MYHTRGTCSTFNGVHTLIHTKFKNNYCQILIWSGGSLIHCVFTRPTHIISNGPQMFCPLYTAFTVVEFFDNFSYDFINWNYRLVTCLTLGWWTEWYHGDTTGRRFHTDLSCHNTNGATRVGWEWGGVGVGVGVGEWKLSSKWSKFSSHAILLCDKSRIYIAMGVYGLAAVAQCSGSGLWLGPWFKSRGVGVRPLGKSRCLYCITYTTYTDTELAQMWRYTDTEFTQMFLFMPGNDVHSCKPTECWNKQAGRPAEHRGYYQGRGFDSRSRLL
jgi:hypothetical protein